MGKRKSQDDPSHTLSKRTRPRTTFRVARPAPTPSSSTSCSNASRVIAIRQHPNGRLGQRKARARTLTGNQTTEEADDNATALPSTWDSALNTPADPIPSTTPSNATTPSAKPKRERKNTTSSKLKEWLPFRDSYLDELLRHNGHGDYLGTTVCSSCGENEGVVKCKDCFHGCLLQCRACVVSAHQNLPLHRIELWDGHFFNKTDLRKLGLRVQLGHGGAPCPLPQAGPQHFLVIDTSGVHRVSVDFCNCRSNGFTHNRTQILRASWFPATVSRPQTAFTFDMLDTFQELTLQGKTTLYDFYHTILRKTDNAKLEKTTYRYPEFHRVFRIWRHLQMLKHAGRAQDPAGADGTSEGELVVECPACPHPGRNLPDKWEEAPAELRFLYILFLAIDANFKLKGKDRGINDVELAPGWGCFVEESRYQQHLACYVDQPEMNTCESQHDAIVRANTRCTPGYNVTGTGLVLCARHALVRKNGVGDLQKGERYCNMDYIVLSTLIGIQLLLIVLSYDIGCQWWKNLRKRALEFPDEMKIRGDANIEVKVPNWHINGHGDFCRTQYSLNYLVGAGRTCGEDVETSWAHSNALGPSVRELGPASRHELLNDHWNGWNFHKIVGFRVLFLKRFNDAFAMREKHRSIFMRLTSTFSANTIQKWEAKVLKWHADTSRPRTKPNPYEEPRTSTTVQDVRLELVQEEADEAIRGILPVHKTSLSGFLTLGLELEEQQRVLQLSVSRMKGKQTSKQLADLQDKRNSLRCRIQRWREIQLAYTPCVAILLAASIHAGLDVDTVPEPAESIRLHLPSSLTSDLCQSSNMPTISEKEQRLRVAQADDALAEIRRQRRILAGLYQFKKLNVSGTGNRPNTRMWTLFSRFNHKIQRYAERYRTARHALICLDPNGDWRNRLRQLDPEDIRGPGRDVDDVSQSRYEPSWIWLVPRVHSAPDIGDSEDQLDNTLEVEWAKSWARRDRWEEEVPLILEEMHRVLRYLEWKARWWKTQGKRRMNGLPETLHGVQAYAEKQASLLQQLACSSAAHWLPGLKKNGICPEWEAQYVLTVGQGSIPVEIPVDDAGDDEWEDDGVEVVDDEFEEDMGAEQDILDTFEHDD